MGYIITDLKFFDELRKKQHHLCYGTLYNAKNGKPISERIYKQICYYLDREVSAFKTENKNKKKGFTIDLFFTDFEMNKKTHKQFYGDDPLEQSRRAAEYLNDPDNFYDIWKDDQILLPNQEINEDNNETSEGELSDNSN